jgi:zinc transport system substrate-binding protein
MISIVILIPCNGDRGSRRCRVHLGRLWAAVAALACLMTAACARNPSSGTRASADSRPTIVTGFYPLYEAASRVGGDQFQVVNLTPAGAEPHDLELTPDEVQRTLTAKLVLYIGNGFQPALEDTVKQRGQGGGSSIDVIEGMNLAAPPPVEGGDGAADEGENLSFDPHVWLDPVLMKDIVTRTEKALAGIDPAHAGTYARNAQGYRAELDALDADYRAKLAGCRRKVIVTSHAAFGYLSKRYGLEQQAISGVSPESEPSPKRLQELAALVRDKGVTTIFGETLVSPRTADALAREAGVTTAVLDPIEGLTPDEVKAGKSYVSVMRDNLAALGTALGCGT